MFPDWWRRQVGAAAWTLTNHFGLEPHGARTAAGLRAGACRRIAARNAAIGHSRLIGTPAKRSPTADGR